jgi:hypothetical protein
MATKPLSNAQKVAIWLAIISAISAIGVAIVTHWLSNPSTGGASPAPVATPSLVLLPPNTVHIPTKESLDEGQVSLVIEPSRTPNVGVDITLSGPSGNPYVWKDVPPRTRYNATFGTTTYLIDILDVDSQQSTARITVSKKRE